MRKHALRADDVAPTLSTITAHSPSAFANNSYINDAQIVLRATFSEPLKSLLSGDITLSTATGTPQVTLVAAVSGAPGSYDITIANSGVDQVVVGFSPACPTAPATLMYRKPATPLCTLSVRFFSFWLFLGHGSRCPSLSA